MIETYYASFLKMVSEGNKGLAILVDPDKFELSTINLFLKHIPKETNCLFVGGSTVTDGITEGLIEEFKKFTSLPIVIFPGDYSQVSKSADAILFLSLLSGRNPEYLVGQQVKAARTLRDMDLEIISTGYILIDGGNESAVERITGTRPMSQNDVQLIVDTAKAGEFLGAKCIYLETGSGAITAVSTKIISEVKNDITIPLIVGGGIRTEDQKLAAYTAGADMVVMGTVFEKKL